MKTLTFFCTMFPLFLLAQSKPDTVQIRQLQLKAQVLLDSADYWASIEICNEALQQLGNSQKKYASLAAELWKIKGVNDWNILDYKAATNDLSQARQLLQPKKRRQKVTLQLLEVLNYTVRNLYDLGHREDSKRLMDSVLELSKMLPLHYIMADAYDNFGVYYGENRDFEMAEDYFLKAKNIREQFLDSKPLLMERSWLWLGMLEREKGQPLNAIGLFQKGLSVVEKHGGNPILKANLLYNIGYAYHDLHEVDQALQYVGEGLRLVQSEHGDRIPQRTADYYKAFGDILRVKKDYQQAINYFNLALELLRTDTFAFGEIQKAIIRHNLGLTYSNAGEYDAADSLYNVGIQALEKMKNHDESILYYMLLFYNSKASLYLFLQKEEAAIKAFENHISIAEKAYGKNSPLLCQYLNNVGIAYGRLQRFEQVHEAYDRAMAILNLNPNDTVSFNGIINPISWSYILWNKADTYFEQFKKAGEYAHIRKSYEGFDIYTKFIDYLRSSYREEGTKAGFIAENKIAYEKCLHTLNTLQKLQPESGFFEKMFAYSEKSKAMILLETIHQNQVADFEGITAEIAKQEDHFRRETQQADDAYFNFVNQKNYDQNQALAMQSALFVKKQDYYDFLSKLEKEYPEYYNLKYAPGIITAAEVQQRILQSGQCLLEYYVGEGDVYIFVINNDTVHLEIISKDENFPLETWVQNMRESITAYHAAPKTAQTDELYEISVRQYADVAARLYEKLIAPVNAFLTSSVIVIPDGALGYLPFDALLSGAPDQVDNLSTFPFFGETHQISYCYSATLFQEMAQKRHKKHPSKKLLAMAPFYHGAFSDLESMLNDKYNSISQVILKSDLGILTHSGEEVYIVGNIMNGEILLDSFATEQRFREIAGDYQILHLSTHGRADDKVCYLAFSEIKDSIENELLFIRDLYNLQLNADMVVLSACETGIGELQQGEGIISLARAFAYSGAKSIVATLWKVDDASTKYLFAQFYQNLKEGMSKDKALWKTKNNFIGTAGGKQLHPFFWAGLTAIGDMDCIK